ncbi:MAG: 2OG-Fe dioxygenase family protein [Variovorax sp.]
MSGTSFGPPCVSPAGVPEALREAGYCVLDAGGVAALLACNAKQLAALCIGWDDLPPDQYLKDGGRYRQRRHSCFIVDDETVQVAALRAHWQPLEYNALHGGMQRWFEPIAPALLAQPLWSRLLVRLAALASGLRGRQPWFIEAHQFRIDTAGEGGIGRPTPEGAHRDGVDLVAVALIDRHGVKGGETRVFETAGRRGERFTMSEPWTLLVLDDARVIHESTPIQPLQEGRTGWRDTLVVTCRAGAFQGEATDVVAATAL